MTMTATVREHPEVAALLVREAAGEELEFADWVRAVTAWYTHGWTDQQWDDWMAGSGFGWTQVDELAAAARDLDLCVEDLIPEVHWQMVLQYAEQRQLDLDDYLNLLDRHHLADLDGGGAVPYAEYEQYGIDPESGEINKEEPVYTSLYVRGTRAPRHLSPTGELWIILEEYHDGCFWLETPYYTERDAKAAADAIAAEKDRTLL
jgi:hypothetical protein